MARGILKLELIQKNSVRKTCFKKRKNSLLRKVRELSILCGVEACAIIMNGPNDPNPAVWPSDPQEAQSVINRFKSMPTMVKRQRMINQEGYLKQRINKMKEQVKEQQLKNRKLEMTEVMYQNLDGKIVESMTKEDLVDLAWVIQKEEKKIQKRIAALMEKTPDPQLIEVADGADVVPPEQSLLMEGMNTYLPIGQQQPPLPPDGYGVASVIPTYGGMNPYPLAGQQLTPPPPRNGYYGGDAFVTPHLNDYYGGQTSMMPPPNGCYGGDASVMPPPNGYYGGHGSTMLAYDGYYFPGHNGFYP